MRCAIPPVVLESTPQADAVRGEQAVQGKEGDDSDEDDDEQDEEDDDDEDGDEDGN